MAEITQLAMVAQCVFQIPSYFDNTGKNVADARTLKFTPNKAAGNIEKY